MQIEEKNRLHGLEAGQLWKIEHGYLQIVELGKRLIHYRMLPNDNRDRGPVSVLGARLHWEF